jgi:hypothetical protein
LQIAANPPVIADLPPQSAAELPFVADLPAVQTAREEKKVPTAGFVAAPISNESSLNDDFFGNCAPSPTTERVKPATKKDTPYGRSPPACVIECLTPQTSRTSCSTGIASPYVRR